MNKSKFVSKALLFTSKTGLQVKKYSPEILVGTAIISGIATVIAACKATKKVDDIFIESDEQKEKVQKCLDAESLSEEYTEEDGKKDLAIIRVQTIGKVVKLYAPTVILGATSIASILASHGLMKKRNAALAAAYMAIDSSFKDYRGRVVDRFGERVDYELKHGIKAEKIGESLLTDEDGNVHVVEQYGNRQAIPSGYAKWFDEANPYWEKDSDYNLNFLLAQQKIANNKLVAKGFLFLNEVYRSLGFEETKAGQIVGWVYDPDNPVGDNYVDFGLFPHGDNRARDFVNGFERSVLLDFNVDGNILDLVKFGGRH